MFKNQNALLEDFAKALDVSEHHFDLAVARYKSLGVWLGREESKVVNFSPNVYSQGSFRLGTVIKPISDDEDYDLDIVVEVDLSKQQITQKDLKELIGQEVVTYAEAHQMNNVPKDRQRCWTLEYAEEARFHMDVLPSIPDSAGFRLLLESNRSQSNYWNSAIAITDNKWSNYSQVSFEWPRSNPNGYAEWFKARTELPRHIAMFSESRGISIDEVPEFRVKTPLQRAVQLLKHHRDILFLKNPAIKPISMVITTLAALAYKGEPDIITTLRNVTTRMEQHITYTGNRLSIKNPVDPLEDFADRWSEDDAKYFFFWLQKAKGLFGGFAEFSEGQALNEILKESFGEGLTKRVMGQSSIVSCHQKTNFPPKVIIQSPPRQWRR